MMVTILVIVSVIAGLFILHYHANVQRFVTIAFVGFIVVSMIIAAIITVITSVLA